MPQLTPTFDTPEDWQPVNVMGTSGRWPSWWRDPTGPEPTIDQSGQSQPQPQPQPNKENVDDKTNS